ncbi:MAG: Asp-tRNA(Asn)/Glu-tRNA(Gln) amidotransferase subunit GatC [Rhodobacteraceae bacterium]|nr:Asp-tRNA(Asn)/Glu-tRNA(Gln) amidotransferase subunit GatC [Paracoccaceae bacterium]
MNLSLEEARKVAHLARIHVSEEELQCLTKEMSSILTFMQQLNEVNVTGIPAMSSVTPMKIPLRKDVVTSGGDGNRILSNAPAAENMFFTVPKVVE